ncbi:MAG: FHA domain-containing protein [Armatimonadetes bacterium]|nr:FHA domain-containing protein [Armatimonadota bacterium]
MSDPNRTQMVAAPVADPNRTIMGSAPSLNTTVTIKPVQCPVCKSFNPPGLMFCNDCGLIFEMALDGDAFGAPAVQLPVLVESTGREHQLRPGANVIGRAGDILIEDTRVSRRHCQVNLENGTATVEDLGSTNGISVAGERLSQGERRAIVHGTTVSLGGFELTLSMPGEAARTVQALSGRTAAISVVPTVSDAVAWLEFPDHEVALSPGSHSFGRRDSNEIVISDPYVSGSHGTFEVTDDGVFLTDTGSTNGTVLNEAKLAPNMRTKLGAGDVVRLGSLEVKLRFKE